MINQEEWVKKNIIQLEKDYIAEHYPDFYLYCTIQYAKYNEELTKTIKQQQKIEKEEQQKQRFTQGRRYEG